LIIFAQKQSVFISSQSLKHNAKTFTLTLKAWTKMRKDAFNANYKYPCISVVFGENSETKVAIIDWEVFQDLVKGSEYED
jgi:hypothetical protein